MSAKSLLPPDVEKYKRTPLFTEHNVPKTLLSRHNTKEGTWALIHVVRGKLRYTVFANTRRGKEEAQDSVKILSSGTLGVIQPQMYHKVELLTEDTAFYIEFYGKSDLGESAVQPPKFVPIETESITAPGTQVEQAATNRGIGDQDVSIPPDSAGVPLWVVVGVGAALGAIIAIMLARRRA